MYLMEAELKKTTEGSIWNTVYPLLSSGLKHSLSNLVLASETMLEGSVGFGSNRWFRFDPLQ